MPDEGTPASENTVVVDKTKLPVRFLTATSLFDGHDASINIMRRILQSAGVEVIHLGHNRSVDELVNAAVEEDVHAIAVSSYQGGHVEYFKYMVDQLKVLDRSNIKIFGGGGGVIVQSEIDELHKYGVTKIFSPQDGQAMGLEGMILEMVRLASHDLIQEPSTSKTKLSSKSFGPLARIITLIEHGQMPQHLEKEIANNAKDKSLAPVLGITGTGGAGKSSITDELIRRFRLFSNEPKIAVLAIDPIRKRTGGALLGDRIRMNSISGPNIFVRSLANRNSISEIPFNIKEIIAVCKLAKFDLIILETPGIGQGDAAIVEHSDISIYVMTPEFGAPSQLEKIDMLDFADIICVNKLDRSGGLDALRDVQKQVQRNRREFSKRPEEMPVFGAIASRFGDAGMDALYSQVIKQFNQKEPFEFKTSLYPKADMEHAIGHSIIPTERQNYLSDIINQIRTFKHQTETQAKLIRERQHITEAKRLLEEDGISGETLNYSKKMRDQQILPESNRILEEWPLIKKKYSGAVHVSTVRGKEVKNNLFYKSQSGTSIPRVVLPKFEDHGDLLTWLLKENLPGYFPFTAGVFPFKRQGEDPTRMFAGEGDAARTNRRFKLLSAYSKAKRLSTAFDSVTLYGFDPNLRPDIFGKIGNSGVSIATIEDMKVLYSGFDLCNPSTSVSMTINGPAPTILAMFLNTAIEQQIEIFQKKNKRLPNQEEKKQITSWSLKNVRGTVQADILKEDQGQNTCIFSTEFALRMMADIQEYFVERQIRNFYSVSISGYHIAEAGANPISQLAFTLANGFTLVESYLARGMKIDDFAPNLSFFFSNGMDPEYSVMGRVARRIWSYAIKLKYGGKERSQKLKYHIQTSGRSLHAQEIDFNDIRTTLQALIAVYDNCNSLHTNAHDEAFTTPTSESLRRAVAIQLIINKEWGLSQNENPNQGSFIVSELTDLVEEAVLLEFERLSQRGGVLGAMETGYQRSKIQEESLLYETGKHDGTIPIIGVNSFINENKKMEEFVPKLQRSSEKEKKSQISRLKSFQSRNSIEATKILEKIRHSAIENKNIFSLLMDAVKVCSLGQITDALFDAGGQYRRNM